MPDAEKWPPYTVIRSENRLKELHSVIEHLKIDADPADPAITELSRLLVVRSCGHLETTFSCCFLKYIERHASKTVADYVEGTFKKWQSPKPDNIKNNLRKMSPAIEERLRNFLTQDGRDYSAELGSLVNERDRISHGDNDRVTIRSSENYYKIALEISEWFLAEFSPGGAADQCVVQTHFNSSQQVIE